MSQAGAAADNSLSTYYTQMRQELAELIAPDARKVLDIGCAAGGLGEAIKELRSDVTVVGIEREPAAAGAAAEKLDSVIQGDVEDLQPDLPDAPFDCIVFADVLEHLRDPQAVLERYCRFLAPGGKVVATVPNVRYWRVSGGLFFRGKWNYGASGVLDRSHLRFFTRKSLVSLFESTGIRETRIRSWHRLRLIPKIATVLTIGWARDFFVWKWLITGHIPRAPAPE